jgi:alanyl-tRNA synthetase
MKTLNTADIRQQFLAFFEEHGHLRVPSSALVPEHDPTLLFTNAGMVQFKDVFTGKERRPYQTATTVQKCLRAGGKHNDLENVGFTPRHHTFFEMLGNFSFGGYFKHEAIKMAWSLVTERFAIPKERLAVTVFAGDEHVPVDEEAEEFWRQVGVPKHRIFRFGRSENFWQMGDTGPQGPCSEIHYCLNDHAPERPDAKQVETSDGWLEIWNLVFMQFVKDTAEGELRPLPRPSVDTGAGLERLAMVLQGKSSTYETDGFARILDHIGRRAQTVPGQNSRNDICMRVIADHARATAFLLADGVNPSNEGRGYVLRRIMRRAIRYGEQLGLHDIFFHEICSFVAKEMSPVYPELERAGTQISEWSHHEEETFRRTLSRGLKRLRDRLEKDAAQSLDPDFVADLWDTYGFPIDLTRIIAQEDGVSVDEAAAEASLHARQAQDQGQLNRSEAIAEVWFKAREQVAPTVFSGYEQLAGEGIVELIIADGAFVETVSAPATVDLVLDRTPFYGESGGQVGDTGRLTWPGGSARVVDARKPVDQLWVHRCELLEGSLTKRQAVRAEVDGDRRSGIRRNHSATHLLHHALRDLLGPHVQQKGSLVAEGRLRFDFSHFSPVSIETLNAIEAQVNQHVLSNLDTVTEEMALEKARDSGAIMLFGEKYADEVRVVRIAEDSVELCGGTHVARSGDIGLFRIIGESSVASGVRRIEAVTGLEALRWTQAREHLLDAAAGILKVSKEAVPDQAEKLTGRVKRLEKDLARAQAERTLSASAPATSALETDQVNGVAFIIRELDNVPKDALREVADRLRDQLGSGVVVLGSREGDRASLLVAVTKDLKDRIPAGEVVKAATQAMQGTGGGRPDFAQGGGLAASLPQALAKARAVIQERTR